MLRCLARHARLLPRVNRGRRWSLGQSGDEPYLPGTTLHLQFQAQGSNTFEPLAVTVVKRFEPFTSAAVLLVQRLSDNEQAILKLADRRLGYRSGNGRPVLWSSSLEDRLRHAVHDIQAGVSLDWFELIRDVENRPDTKLWEDWMWEVSTWRYKLSSYNTELAAYRLLHRLQGRYIPRLFGVVHLCITPESTPLHPITDVVQGLVFEYIPGVSMAKLKPGVDVPEQEAEGISSQVMEVFRAIEAENCVLHNVVHIGNVVLREGNRSPVIIDFGQADIREPELSDEEWSGVVWGSPDTAI